ncbi:MAG: Gfo/Idh/MocA family oxidoreductase [Rhodothermales bacterium]|nr:Gfo/Idh/MocA family oxidoreductase [Rhodothermales bacterium]
MIGQTVGWGILAPGRIAHRFADALRAVEGAELVAVASRDQSRADAFAGQYHAARAYGAYEQLLLDDRVDAIYIATPHRYHFDNARMCLEGGKHVLCEKPITVTADEAASLVALSQERGLFLMEALWTVFLPIYEQVREWLDADVIGDPLVITSNFGFRAQRDPDGRLLNPGLTGGALLDIGVYNIAVSRWVMGRDPDSLSARSILGETGVDEVTVASLQYGVGAFSQLTVTLRCQTRNDFTIYGPDGYIRIEPNFWEATRATLVVNGQEKTVEKAFRLNGFEYEIDEAVSCIREGLAESPRMPHFASLGTMQVMDEIRRQIQLKYPFE